MFTVINDLLSAWAGLLIVLAAGLLVMLAAMVWIIFFRKNRRHRHRRRLPHGEDRSSNPTLAQIGGLPPLKQTRKLPVPRTPTVTS